MIGLGYPRGYRNLLTVLDNSPADIPQLCSWPHTRLRFLLTLRSDAAELDVHRGKARKNWHGVGSLLLFPFQDPRWRNNLLNGTKKRVWGPSLMGILGSNKYTLKLRQVKKKMSLVRISIKKRGGRPFFFFLLFIISYFILSLHIITLSQGYVGALRSNINKTKHQVLIKHKFV